MLGDDQRPTQVIMTQPPRPVVREHSDLQLAALPTAMVCAQLFAEYTLRAWRLDHLIDPVDDTVTALVARAVRTTGVADPRPRWVELNSLNLIVVQCH